MTIRRVYSETLPYSDLVRPRTLDLLVRYGLELVLAVRPWDVPSLPELARQLRDRGILLSIWPMLDDDQGRWASAHNASEFARFVISTCDVLEAADVRPRDVLFDLEPPIAHARSLASLAAVGKHTPEDLGRLGAVFSRSSARASEDASRALLGAVSELDARGIARSMAVWPLVALDPPGRSIWQSLLGTPVDALGHGHVSVMMYTSLLEGWSLGTLRRRDTTALLAAATERTTRRWGSGAGISLGCVGTGAFASEPTYRRPSELAEDVAIARRAGCDKLSLFDLGGVLAREPAEAWFDAFVSGGEREPDELTREPSARRVRAVQTMARIATWAFCKRG